MSKKKTVGITTFVVIIIVLTANVFISADVDWNELLKQTMPEAERFTQVKDYLGLKSRNFIQNIFPAYKGDTQVGVIYYAAPNGYSGKIHTLVALDTKGTIKKVNVFRHTETPAYVGPIRNGSYQKQFEGITLGDKLAFLIGSRPSRRGEIQSITGATETAKPIAFVVSEARKLFVEAYGSR